MSMGVMMSCPCINCITLAICRAYYLQMKYRNEGMTTMGVLNYLKKDCELLQMYLTTSPDNFTAINRYKNTSLYIRDYPNHE